MRTSLRVFTAAVASLLVVGFLTVVPFARPSAAVSGIHQVTVTGAAVDEGNAGLKSITATVHLNVQNFVPTVAIKGDVQLTDGTARVDQDFVANTQHFEFPGGSFVSNPDITLTFPNVIKGDTFAEPNETITLTVKNLEQADLAGSSPATIKNDDAAPAAFKITKSPDAPEGNGSNIRIVKVELTKNADQDTTLNWATADASATTDPNKGAKDYTPAEGMLTWHAGEKQAQEINVVVNGDTIPEPDEIFGVNFGAPNNAQLNDANSIVKLTNDDGTDIPVFDIAPIPDKTEGDSGATAQTVTVTLTSNAQQNTAVDWILVDGTAKASTQDAKGDFEQDPDVSHHTLIFTKGTTSRTIDVPVNGDTANEPDEGYAVQLVNPINANLGANSTRTAVIKNDDFGQITTGPSTFGGPHVRLWGANGGDLGGFFSYTVAPNSPPYNAGIHVARGDIFKADGSVGADGVDEVIVGPGKGITARVLIMSTDGAVKASFFPFTPQFDGGVYVAAGEIDGDTANGDEIVVGAGPGGGPHVRVMKVTAPNADNVKQLGSFFPYDTNFKGGVRVAVGDMNNDNKAEIITAPGPGGGPNVKVNRLNAQGLNDVLASWYAYGANFPGGVSVAAAKNKIVTGAGPGGNPHVRLWDGTGHDQGGWYAYNEGFTGGVNVGMGNLDNTSDPEIVTGAGAGGGPHVRVWNTSGAEPFGGGFYAYDPNFHGGVEIAVAVANG